MKKEKKEMSTKKFIILILLILSVTGFTGYGMYSYFYTRGILESVDFSMNISDFRPFVYNGGFLYGENTPLVDTECSFEYYDSDNQTAEYRCTSMVGIENLGSTPVEAHAYDVTLTFDSNDDTTNVETSEVDVCYWDDTYITVNPSSTEYFNLCSIVYIHDVGGSPSSDSSEPEYVYNEIASYDLHPSLSCSVRATEVDE